ncbi:MAG: hypothetical protein JSS02_15730 [Planctomycetes bacterium]|nr:hypothetical protein [Planctomycetota bacterium]
MTPYVRLLPDRQTTVITVPGTDYSSLRNDNLRRLRDLLRFIAEHAAGTTVVLDVTLVRHAGAGFLTEVHRFARLLHLRRFQLILAGELYGLFSAAGWHRFFLVFAGLEAAVRDRFAGADGPPRWNGERVDINPGGAATTIWHPRTGSFYSHQPEIPH